MILPKAQDALHRGQLYRLLIEIADDISLTKNLIFKGGTCASLMDKLDRFSIDLDFDIKREADIKEVTEKLEKIFLRLGFEIKNKSKNTVQYYLKYSAPAGARNTLKLDAVNVPFNADISEPTFLADIDRYMVCQTTDTMFAHKLVAVTDRYKKHNAIAGRDIYDIHFFFINGFEYNQEIIKERTGLQARDYFIKLRDFIEVRVTETIINEDINTLLPYEKFSAIRKSLKSEVLGLLKDEILRIKSKN
ncbi:MAG: nucleotidyl transferase AbiEii/AbiGii toxin family protein [bacterium]